MCSYAYNLSGKFGENVKRSIFCMVILVVMLCSVSSALAQEKIKIRVFIGAQFEIGNNTGDEAGEFQHWYERYFTAAQKIKVAGAEHALFVNKDGVAGSVLGVGKVRSSSSMTAILADPRFDFSKTYFIITGCAGTPPSVGTIAAVFWSDWLVDYDLGYRWAFGEVPAGAPLFAPREGDEEARLLKVNPALVARAYKLTKDTPLNDTENSKKYRLKYPEEAARRDPFVGIGSSVTADTFFHGPGLSREAQYICDLYKAGTYSTTEMEGMAVAYVIKKYGHADRVISLRTPVNFDQGIPSESILKDVDPVLEGSSGSFASGIHNVAKVGIRFVDHVIANWSDWSKGVPEK